MFNVLKHRIEYTDPGDSSLSKGLLANSTVQSCNFGLMFEHVTNRRTSISMFTSIETYVHTCVCVGDSKGRDL